MNYLWHILVMISLYVVLASSLNLLAGYGGILSLCHASFFGVGAYVTTLLMVRTGWPFFAALLAAVLVTTVFGVLVSSPALRLRGDYLVLSTLGFQVIVYDLLYNCTGLTGGPYGITNIPAPIVWGFSIDNPLRFCVLSCFVTSLATFLLWSLTNSPYGRLIKAIRDDELAAISLGKNTFAIKTSAFAIAAGFAAVAGGLFAAYMHFIDPSSFTIDESIFILLVVVIGGAGDAFGPILGAVLLVVLPEVLRFLPIPDQVAANLRQVIWGLLLVILMRYRPQGIKGEYRFG